MRLDKTVKYNLKHGFKSAVIVSLAVCAALFLIIYSIAGIGEHAAYIESECSGVFTFALFWVSWIMSVDLFCINYKITVSNCISRKTAICTILIINVMLAVFMTLLSMSIEHLCGYIFGGFEYFKYTPFGLTKFADPVVKFFADCGVQAMLYLTGTMTVAMYRALNAKVNRYVFIIAVLALIFGFMVIVNFYERISGFLLNTLSIDLSAPLTKLAILSVLLVIVSGIFVVLFRRVSYAAAEK